MDFIDRLLKCTDCGTDFVFTAGEQLFFFDKQFKNDPKRCKLCKAKRAGLGRTAAVGGAVALPLSRTETRTECSACGIETTVPFKPTQGRPVLCRSCFQMKRVPTGVAAGAGLDSAAEMVAQQSAALDQVLANGGFTAPDAISPVMQAVADTPMAALCESRQAEPELMAMAAEAAQA